MELIRPIDNSTHGATEPGILVASYYIMKPGVVYSFLPATEAVLANDGMLIFSVIRILFNKL